MRVARYYLILGTLTFNEKLNLIHFNGIYLCTKMAVCQSIARTLREKGKESTYPHLNA